MFRQTRKCLENDQEVFMPYDQVGNTPYNQGEYMQMEGANCQPMVLPGMECAPIYEPGCENVVHRQINHHVQHIQPIHTRIINNHIYHHSFMPCYTCCEENVCCNVYNPNPCCK